jgi:formate hydrogenlyase subunit 6/NADH:ubiquinone oxidoreductase subunit I
MAYYLDQRKLDDFIRAISRGRVVFAHEPHDDQLHLVRAGEWVAGRHVLGRFRPIEPLKALVFRPREFLGSFSGEQGPSAMEDRIAIGVKNCDLSALRIHDYVFLKTEPVDPLYAEAREKTILVSCDCSDACATCFCPVVNEQPYAKTGFDINLSPISRGFVVEAGSDRGEKLMASASQYLEPATEALLAEGQKNRDAMFRKVEDQAARKGLKPGLELQKAIRASAEAEMWDEFARDCVECGACNFVCCTCHCFLLADGLTKARVPSRVKQWDSCLYRNFARVAGGANPRKHRAERLHNRFDKKFNFFPEVLKTFACDGCGRCAEACTGKIDIRDVLKKAVDEMQ